MAIVSISTKGQIVLPLEIRNALGLQKGDKLEVRLEQDRVILTRLLPAGKQDWRRWRGCLAGTQALQEHITEHRNEVADERLP